MPLYQSIPLLLSSLAKENLAAGLRGLLALKLEHLALYCNLLCMGSCFQQARFVVVFKAYHPN
jgi:hypothetical protein